MERICLHKELLARRRVVELSSSRTQHEERKQWRKCSTVATGWLLINLVQSRYDYFQLLIPTKMLYFQATLDRYRDIYICIIMHFVLVYNLKAILVINLI